MIKKLILLASLLATVVGFYGCSTSVDNGITFNNQSSGDILFNFRGSVTDIPSQKVVTMKEIPSGKFDYAITFSYPAGATSTSVVGSSSGTLTISASTKVLFLFSSSYINSAYTLNISMSSSNNQSSTTVTGP